MDIVVTGEPDNYTGQKSYHLTPQKKIRGVPTLDFIDAQENLRASISSGVGVSRALGMKQSRTNLVTVSRRMNQQTNSPDANRSSPKGNLFLQNKETLEMMLVRKLRSKYIENNSAFATAVEEA